MGIANKVCDFLEFWYYQYILVTALYMLESWERAVFSILVVMLGILPPAVTGYHPSLGARVKCELRNCEWAFCVPHRWIFSEEPYWYTPDKMMWLQCLY